jgi:hypothetical protein
MTSTGTSTETSAGNLSTTERSVSALVGVGFSILALSRGPPLARAIFGAIAGSLLARAAAGHCGVKSMLSGHTSLREGLSDQWRGMSNDAHARTHGLPGSPMHTEKSRAVDESVAESFPASDPPASRLPDEPPSNADAKWAAARAAGKVPR